MDRYAFYSSVERYKDANPEEHEKDAIKHYGIMGQKWGQRRWQNPDGTFNQAGKERYFGSGKNEKNPEGVIGNSSNKKNPSGNMEGSVADHFHKNIYVKTDKNTLKKIKKYPDIYDTEGLTDKEILQAIRRVPKIPYSAEYGRQIREELYRAQMNKKRAKYYDDNSKDVSEEENIEDQKIEGSDPKEEKKLQKEAKKLEKELMSKNGDYEYADGNKVEEWLNKEENKEMVNNYMNTYDKHFNKMSKELKEVFKDYDEDENGYISKAGLYEAIESGDSNLLYLFGTMNWFLGDDGDQGSRNSRSYYLQDKGNSMSDIISLYNRFDESQNIAQHESLAALEKEPIYNHLNDKIQRSIANRLYWMYNEKNDYVNSKMEDAVQGMPRDNKIVNEVNKISKKLSPSCGDKDSNGWWYVSKAIENLNLESLDYKELTDADWDKINAEVNKLKK